MRMRCLNSQQRAILDYPAREHVSFGRVSSSDFSSHRQQTPEHGEYISPHFDLAVRLVAPRYGHFDDGKLLSVRFCDQLGVKRKSIASESDGPPHLAPKRFAAALKIAYGSVEQ
jgi:hypothetical protein